MRLRRFHILGCDRRGAAYRANGSRGARVVALTFDDGPSAYTASVLRILRRENVHATFFLIGGQVHAGAALVRRELREGDAVGDHTYTHPDVSGGGPFAAGQILRTIRAIRAVAGYRPCLFRAPYGAVSRALVGIARSAALTTIEWDVDPRDWSRPGTGAIISRVLGGVRPGSIVIMHDGGGPRGETVAAVTPIIHALRARGYRFMTVPQLLGYRTRYRYQR